MRTHCIFVGLNTVDALALLREPVKEDEKIQADAILVEGGGPTATAACAFSKAGGKAALVTAIGRDHWTPFALKQLHKYKVDTAMVRVRPQLGNPLSLILVNTKTAARTVIWNSQGLANERLRLSAAERKKIFSAQCLHFDGHLMADSIELAAEAKKRGLRVSYDCGSVKKGWEKLAHSTDYFIASHRFARDFGLPPRAAVAALKKRFGYRTAVTCGEKGVYYFCNASQSVKLLPQRRFRAVDTTGCGDVFHGFFLASMLKHNDFKKALAFAQLAAGLKTLKPGGRAGIPELTP